jgi:hypothetical protein
MKVQVMVFWVVTPCSDVVGYQRFGGSCRLHGQEMSQQDPPKRWYSTSLHGVTLQKTTA